MAIMDEARALWSTRGIQTQRLRPSGVVMIGDSEADVLAGRRCGARTVGCTYGLAPETLLSAAPDYFVDSPLAWPAVLGVKSRAVWIPS